MFFTFEIHRNANCTQPPQTRPEPKERFPMFYIKQLAIVVAVAGLIHSAPVRAADADTAPTGELKIDVPVPLKASKVVFNMDHLAFAGDHPIGLAYMKLMLQNYKAKQTPLQIIAVFHGAAGYMLLNDAAYNKARRSDKGNPYKEAIASLQKEGVEFEECGQTARANGWVNSNLLPDVKVNTGANLRLVQLMQDGFVSLQP
jgi:intracellular sulfur oxidation DsrE/DsrF family protein